ncbi:MAG: amidohydrolase family protein [Capsulimonadaceae bacterium]|nr:amidohydrolase family protein [Capsulimonadaceae bacterium]
MPTLRARWVLPIGRPAIENGEVVVAGHVIAEVRPARSGPCDLDLGDAVLMPGLVNAHTHLEYTALRGFTEDLPFFEWIRSVVQHKTHFDEKAWRVSAQLGALECLAGGITTVADNTDAGVTMEVLAASGLRGVVYQEVFGIDQREPVDGILGALKTKIDAHRRLASDRVVVGISPHALYTVRPELFDALIPYAREQGLPISIHVAESEAETMLTEEGAGPFADMFRARGIQWTTPEVSPTQYLADQGALTRMTLAVHCVQQSSGDIANLARSGAAIVYCPKSNAKLGSGVAPLPQWLATPGLRIALGTDSALSNNTLDMFEEMRFGLLAQRSSRKHATAPTARQMVELATLGGARALGLEHRVGTLAPGREADLIAVDMSRAHTTPATEPYGALVFAARAGDVRLTMIGGRVVYRDGHWSTLDAPGILDAARTGFKPAGQG